MNNTILDTSHNPTTPLEYVIRLPVSLPFAPHLTATIEPSMKTSTFIGNYLAPCMVDDHNTDLGDDVVVLDSPLALLERPRSGFDGWDDGDGLFGNPFDEEGYFAEGGGYSVVTVDEFRFGPLEGETAEAWIGGEEFADDEGPLFIELFGGVGGVKFDDNIGRRILGKARVGRESEFPFKRRMKTNSYDLLEFLLRTRFIAEESNIDLSVVRSAFNNRVKIRMNKRERVLQVGVGEVAEDQEEDLIWETFEFAHLVVFK